MNDLMLLLDRAAGPDGAVETDAHADLARGRRALARTRRRRGAAGLAGVAAVGVLGAGAAQRLSQDSAPPVATPSERRDLTGEPVVAGPFSFATTPAGWHVQGHRPGSVTFARDDGSSDPHPDSFVGKIVLLYDIGPIPGETVTAEGRDFRVSDHGDTMTVATRTRQGEPHGFVLLQVPAVEGWSVDTAIEMLAGVQVETEAQAPTRNGGATYEVTPDGYVIIGD